MATENADQDGTIQYAGFSGRNNLDPIERLREGRSKG